jgi:lipopolysaccharide/colanic/teichoic acid biosynthesis glycosyltransferase
MLEYTASRKTSLTTTAVDMSTALPKQQNARMLYAVVKRITDVVISSVFLVLLAPLLCVIAIAVKLDSPGGVFFRQRVIGKNGRDFTLCKFRSMFPGSQDASHQHCLERNVVQESPVGRDESGRPVFKTALLDRSRITRFGRVLRKTSLDETPQLWTVLRGDMSLVGPRPSLPTEVSLYQPWQRERLAVKPGLTGLYQVTARNRVSVMEMTRIDIAYVRKQSPWMDLTILFRTPAAMFRGM